MLIVEFKGPSSSCLDASKTGENSKYLWVGVVEGIVRDCVFKTCGKFMAPSLIKSIDNPLPWRKEPVKSGKYDTVYMLLSSCKWWRQQCTFLKHFQVNSAKQKWFNAVTVLKFNECGMELSSISFAKMKLWRIKLFLNCQNIFTSSEWETTSFCSHFSTNPRRLESETQPRGAIKIKKHSPENSSEIYAFLAWAVKW